MQKILIFVSDGVWNGGENKFSFFQRKEESLAIFYFDFFGLVIE